MFKLFSPMAAGAVAFMLIPLVGPAVAAASPGALVVTSPDGRSSITIERDARRGESVIAASPLGLDLDVGVGDVLQLRLAFAGGAAVILEPAKK